MMQRYVRLAHWQVQAWSFVSCQLSADFIAKIAIFFWSVECFRHGFVPGLLRSDTSNGRFGQVDPSQISRYRHGGGSCVAQVRIFMN